MATEREDVKSDDGSPEIKPRPIVQLGNFIIAPCDLLRRWCLGAAAFTLLAKNTYIPENALMPGSPRSMLSHRHVSDGRKMVKDINNFRLNHQGKGVEVQRLIGKYMSEVYYQKFHTEGNQFTTLHFFSCPASYTLLGNVSSASYGVNVAGIVRAPRGDGKESIVLDFSLGIAGSLFSLLAGVTWISKDIICEYHPPSFEVSGLFKCDALNTSDSFRRPVTVAAALVDRLSIYADASNGQMPNLDRSKVVNYLAVHRQGFYVKVEKVVSLFSSIAHLLNPDWSFGIPAADYLEGSATLASSLYSQQALGIPTGPHKAFRDYQADTITLKLSPRFPPDSKARQVLSARLLEGPTRSVNNLLEKFHQSFFLYLLTSPGKFVSVGVYIIAFALLVAPLPMVAASLYIDGCNALTKPTENLKSWKWLDAAKQVFAFALVGFHRHITLLPYFTCQQPGQHSSTNRSILWATTSSSLLVTTFVTIPGCSPSSSRHHGTNWAVLKSVTISAALIGLCLMSIINFATAQIGALLLLVKCVVQHGVAVLVTIAFPVMFFAISNGLIGEGLVGLSLGGEFWRWLELLWAWKSATYVYIGMVHLPCWLLCLCILFHPSQLFSFTWRESYTHTV
ncbi:hypothetical protein Bca4012_026282 [Brassica carinata]|uniref:Uncharacterized protein n=1 Tax=Brassica carinata TaxID=52824 RepID=A0A8X8AUB3_BRACI|nr:hypothetical protein Bca52824_023369 [Brassica carinata]